MSANSITLICCGFVVPTSRTDASPRLLCWSQVATPSTASGRCSQVRRRCVLLLCQRPVIIICLYYNMVDFMDKFAEFVCWIIPMLYETQIQNTGEFRLTYLCPTGAAFRRRCLEMFLLSTLRLNSPVWMPLLDKRLSYNVTWCN